MTTPQGPQPPGSSKAPPGRPGAMTMAMQAVQVRPSGPKVLRIGVIQGGLKHQREDLPPVIPHETTATTGLRHLRGTVSLARFAPGAVYHSFFICLRDEPALDFGGVRHPDGQGFAAFAQVTHGFDVVQRIFAQAEAQEYLEHEIRIARVRIL